MDIVHKIALFTIALQDIYKDEPDRELLAIPKIPLKSESLTEDFTAMIFAIFTLYREFTGDEIDALGFTHIVNRIIVQDALKKR